MMYEVIIRNGRIEWTTQPPPQVSGGQPVHAQVRLLDENEITKEQRGLAMADALERIAQSKDAGLPEDPDQWLRDAREDRPLPGRT